MATPWLGTVALVALFGIAGCAQPAGTPTSTATTGPTQTARVGDVVGYYTIAEIHADRLEGYYQVPYPVATSGPGSPRTLHVGDEVGAACEGRTYILTAIDAPGQVATFTEKRYSESPGGCPICLSGDTLIDTPAGPVNVKELRIGMTVWSLKDGQKEALPIEKVSRTPSPHHVVVHLVLADGRELSASPGHPLTDGRLIGSLVPGDWVDGARVASAGLVKYGQPYTYDILAGDGNWANGILVASTLE